MGDNEGFPRYRRNNGGRFEKVSRKDYRFSQKFRRAIAVIMKPFQKYLHSYNLPVPFASNEVAVKDLTIKSSWGSGDNFWTHVKDICPHHEIMLKMRLCDQELDHIKPYSLCHF